MSVIPVLMLVAVVAVVLLVRKTALISAKNACRYLEQGGVIIDVRTPEEFRGGHVPNAINLPLSGLPNDVTQRFPNKDQVLLLHCLAGGRSAVAQRLLRAKGYAHAYNLGSYQRARSVVSSCSKTSSSDEQASS
jgi:phage shock protein E